MTNDGGFATTEAAVFVEHTAEHPFCSREVCSCREDQVALERVQEYVREGLMTSEEAAAFVSGRTV